MMRLILSFFWSFVSLSGWCEVLTVTVEDIQKWQPIGLDGSLGAVGRNQEKVMGRADFLKVAALPNTDPNRLLSEKVGILLDATRGGFCSGSLVGPDLFLTNHHCVVGSSGNLISVKGLAVWMEYLGGNAAPDKHNAAFVMDIASHDANLDYALLKLTAPLGQRYGWLQLEDNANQIHRARAVKIIQHPAGRAKEIVIENTEVINCGQSSGSHFEFCYLADTEGGSSGSPVFNLEGDRIIALHKMGIDGQFNAGTQAHFIFEKIHTYLPTSTPRREPTPTPAKIPQDPNTHKAEPPADNNQGWKPII